MTKQYPWRNSIVKNLCQQMLDRSDFRLCPELATQLEEAGYTQTYILASLRKPDTHKYELLRIVARLYGEGPIAESVKWMENLVRDVNYRDTISNAKYEELVEIGNSDDYPNTFKDVIDLGYELVLEQYARLGGEAGQDWFDNQNNREVFFEHWSIITGQIVPPHIPDRASVGCSC